MIGNTNGPFFRVLFIARKRVARFGVPLQLDLLDEVFASRGNKKSRRAHASRNWVLDIAFDMHELLEVRDGRRFIVVGLLQIQTALPIFLRNAGHGSFGSISGGFVKDGGVSVNSPN